MSVALFNGAEHWGRLTPAQQAEIGALALELVAAWNAMERVEEDGPGISWPDFDIMEPDGDMPLIDALREAFVEAIPREALEAPDGNPRVPASLWVQAEMLAGRSA